MPSKNVYIPLRADEAKALRELAMREDRDPRRQAARYVRDGLVRAGALPPDRADQAPVGHK